MFKIKKLQLAVATACVVTAATFFYFRNAEPNYSAVLHTHAPYHATFARTAQLIEKKQWTGALAEAKQLKTSMEGDKVLWKKAADKSINPGALLYAFNLLRIAMLEKESGAHTAELQTLAELERNAGWAQTEHPPALTYDPASYELVAESLRIGEVSLKDYIAHRKSQSPK